MMDFKDYSAHCNFFAAVCEIWLANASDDNVDVMWVFHFMKENGRKPTEEEIKEKFETIN